MTTVGLEVALRERFGEEIGAAALEPAVRERLDRIVSRGSCRAFEDRAVPLGLLRLIAAAALSAPSKSDLQQRDVIILQDPDLLLRIKALMAGQDWIAGAPALMVFCANNRRQRQIHAHWRRPFANDHLDAFFNASVDAGIALATGVIAAEAVGLGCCPISAIRNRAAEVSALLALPDHVFPVAALALGWPAPDSRRISPRLPLSATVHVDRFAETDIAALLQGYDARHAKPGATARQRDTDRFGQAEVYGWSDDKTRQYAASERADFGAFVRAKGFCLD